jgi:hypothetical protein
MDGVTIFSTRMLGLWLEGGELKRKWESNGPLVPDRYRAGGPVGWLLEWSVLIHLAGVCLVVMSTFGVLINDQYDLLLYAIEIVCFPISTSTELCLARLRNRYYIGSHDDVPSFTTVPT